MEIFIEIVLGMLLGFSVGLTGVGGAALTIPCLVIVLGLSTVSAIASTFPFTASVKLIGFLKHRKQGTFNTKVSIALLTGGVPGTVIGVFLISKMFAKYGSDMDPWLNVSIGSLLLLGIAPLLGRIRTIRATRSFGTSRFTGKDWISGSVVGSVLGLVVGSTAIGAGSLMVAPMVLIFKLSTATVVGTTIGVSLVMMTVGTVGYLSGGFIDWTTVAFLLTGGLPAVLFGSSLTTRIADKTLVKIVAAIMVIGACGLVVKGAVTI